MVECWPAIGWRLVSFLCLMLAACGAAAAEGRKKPAGALEYAVVGGTVFRDNGFALADAEVTLEVSPEPASNGKLKVKKLKATSSPRGEFSFQQSTRMNRLHDAFLLMVVHNLDVPSVTVFKLETDPPRSIDGHGPVIPPVALELMRAHGFQRAKLAQRRRGVEGGQHFHRRVLVHSGKLIFPGLRKTLGRAAGPRLDHMGFILRLPYNAMRIEYIFHRSAPGPGSGPRRRRRDLRRRLHFRRPRSINTPELSR